VSVLLAYAALACVAAGLVIGAVTLVIGGGVRTALQVALDFWLAAGLLRLGGPPGWPPLLVAAAIVVVRRLAASALRRPTLRPDEDC
jgi:hypothetical protein